MFRRTKIRYDFQKDIPSHRSNQGIVARGTKRKRYDNNPPLCLNPTCRMKGERHYLSQCPISDNNTKTTLLEEYRKAKRARVEAGRNGAEKIGRVTEEASSPHSSVFRASFANGKIEVSVMADQGADANLMSKSLLRNVQKKIADRTTKCA